MAGFVRMGDEDENLEVRHPTAGRVNAQSVATAARRARPQAE